MRTVNSLMVMLCAFSLAGLLLVLLPGCEMLKRHNSFFVDIAVNQAVVRYLDSSADQADAIEKRERLISSLSVARQFVSTDSPVELGNWENDFIQLMNWDSLAIRDQILIRQVLSLIRQEIELRSAGHDEVKIYLGRVIDVAINTARQL